MAQAALALAIKMETRSDVKYQFLCNTIEVREWARADRVTCATLLADLWNLMLRKEFWLGHSNVCTYWVDRICNCKVNTLATYRCDYRQVVSLNTLVIQCFHDGDLLRIYGRKIKIRAIKHFSFM